MQMNEKKRKISKAAAKILKDLGIRLIHLAPMVNGGMDNMSYGAITEVYNDLMHALGYDTWSDIS